MTGKLTGPSAGATADLPTTYQSVRKLAELDVQTIICYHGGVVVVNANQQLQQVAQELAQK